MSTSLGMVPGMGNPRLELAPIGRLLPIVQTASVFVGSHPFYSGKRALQSVANADTVTATDETYGSKEVIRINSRVYDYLLANVREPQILRELREETATFRGSQMQVSPDQAQLLAMLVQILGAERCIEVGVYTGYSSLAIALVLPEGGRLVACERDAKSLEVAKRYYDLAGVLKKVDVKHGLAADTLKSMIQNGEGGSYDFAFVDAEKKMYRDYFELLLQLQFFIIPYSKVRVGGIIVMDNVLWHGKVADPVVKYTQISQKKIHSIHISYLNAAMRQVNDSKTVSIRNFNKILMMDERVSISMVPIGDGMTICRKR